MEMEVKLVKRPAAPPPAGAAAPSGAPATAPFLAFRCEGRDVDVLQEVPLLGQPVLLPRSAVHVSSRLAARALAAV